MMLYFSGIRRSESGTPGVNEISRRFSMSSERLGDTVSRHQLDRNGEGLPLVVFHWFLPLRLLRFGSCRWVALDDDTALILGLPEPTRTFDSGKNEDGVDDPSVVLEESVKLDEATECVYKDAEDTDP